MIATHGAGNMPAVVPTVIAGLAMVAAVSAAAWFALLLLRAHALLTRPRRVATVSRPRWVQLVVPCLDPLAEAIGPRLPLWVRQRVHSLLRRAGLDETLQPQQFVALTLLMACSSAVLALAIPRGVAFAIPLVLALPSLPWLWLRDAALRREREALRDLPFYLDMLTLALEAGGTLSVALRAATERAPESVLRSAFTRVQLDLRAGRSRSDALRALAERMSLPAMTPLVAALVQADAGGSSLAPVLRAQADQRLSERFNEAERRALEAPVKMLAPLVVCIFPCTFVMLAFPLALRFIDG